MCGNPRKNPCGYWTGDGCAMSAGQRLAQFVDCREFSLGYATHESVHLKRSRDNKCPRSPTLAHPGFNSADLRKAFTVGQFFLPGFSFIAHQAISSDSRDRVDGGG